jgi:hypothetical protein
MDEPVGTDQVDQVDKEAAAHVEEVFRCLGETLMDISTQQAAICQTIGNRRIETVRLINQMADKIIEISTAQNNNNDAIIAINKVLTAMAARIEQLAALIEVKAPRAYGTQHLD